jgi:outer membrane protein OmpA-like peptidoglycan-associated protein
MSFNSADDDSQQHFILVFLLALILLVVFAVVGGVAFKRSTAHAHAGHASAAHAPAAPAAPVPAATPAVETPAAAQPDNAPPDDAASVLVDGGVVKFFFASGKADLAEGANAALADVVKGALEGGKTVQISGFHDATGDAAANEELAKQRAMAVRDALKALGVAEDKIDLKKPEDTQASGSNAQARRVEVTLEP